MRACDGRKSLGFVDREETGGRRKTMSALSTRASDEDDVLWQQEPTQKEKPRLARIVLLDNLRSI
jgi:hypothetical protein